MLIKVKHTFVALGLIPSCQAEAQSAASLRLNGLGFPLFFSVLLPDQFQQPLEVFWLTGWDLNLGLYYSFEENREGKLFDFKKPYKRKIGKLQGEPEGNWSEGMVRSHSYGPRIEYTPQLFSMSLLKTDVRLLLAYRVRLQQAEWDIAEHIESSEQTCDATLKGRTSYRHDDKIAGFLLEINRKIHVTVGPNFIASKTLNTDFVRTYSSPYCSEAASLQWVEQQKPKISMDLSIGWVW